MYLKGVCIQRISCSKNSGVTGLNFSVTAALLVFFKHLLRFQCSANYSENDASFGCILRRGHWRRLAMTSRRVTFHAKPCEMNTTTALWTTLSDCRRACVQLWKDDETGRVGCYDYYIMTTILEVPVAFPSLSTFQQKGEPLSETTNNLSLPWSHTAIRQLVLHSQQCAFIHRADYLRLQKIYLLR